MNDPIAVVVPNYNGGPFIAECLDALRRQTVQPAEVVVVDNASTDGSADLVRSCFADVQVISLGTNTGFAVAANRGVAATTSPYVVVLNSDTVPEPDWLYHLRDAPRDDRTWAWGSVLLEVDGATIESAGDVVNLWAMASKHLKGAPADAIPDTPYEVFAPPGAAPMFRRDVFAALGGYCERFFLYYEDVDLAFRARLLGFTALMVPAARVRHRLGGSGNLARARYFAARNSMWVAVRNLPRPGPRVLWQAMQRGLVDARNKGYVGVYLRGRVAGMAGLPWAFRTRRSIQRARVVSDDQVRAMLLSRPGGHAVR